MTLTQMLVQAEEVLNSGGQMTTWDILAFIGLGTVIYFAWKSLRFIREMVVEAFRARNWPRRDDAYQEGEGE